VHVDYDLLEHGCLHFYVGVADVEEHEFVEAQLALLDDAEDAAAVGQLDGVSLVLDVRVVHCHHQFAHTALVRVEDADLVVGRVLHGFEHHDVLEDVRHLVLQQESLLLGKHLPVLIHFVESESVGQDLLLEVGADQYFVVDAEENLAVVHLDPQRVLNVEELVLHDEVVRVLLFYVEQVFGKGFDHRFLLELDLVLKVVDLLNLELECVEFVFLVLVAQHQPLPVVRDERLLPVEPDLLREVEAHVRVVGDSVLYRLHLLLEALDVFEMHLEALERVQVELDFASDELVLFDLVKAHHEVHVLVVVLRKRVDHVEVEKVVRCLY